MLALYKWLLMLQYQLDQLDMGGFFSTTLGKKYTGHHPWCMMHSCIFNICVSFLHKIKRVISLGSKNEMCFIILHHCQIRGSPRPMTFTFDFYTRCAQQKSLVKLSILIQISFFNFLCISVVKTSDNWTADHEFDRDICLQEL